ncbi:MAG: sodium/solute symporter, partial [Gemmatimonadota bacterium]|nr:sodium/solute symporter [Gemmatimonadota bacterium]
MAFMLGIFFYTAAKTMNILCGWPIYTSILITALVVGAYTLFGGLAAVVYTDVIQFFVLFAGSMVILLIAMAKVGGWHELTETVHSLGAGYEHHFDLVVPVDSKTPYGWGGILFGLVVVLSPAYCIGNQAIVQRALGARTEHEAKKSMLWGAFLKLFIPVLLVGPGLAGIVLHPGLNNGDDIYPTLIHDLLPPGLTGLVFAAFLAALMSSVDSYLNSGATLWTKDIYQQYIRPGRDEAHYMVVGKVFTACLVAVGIILAPLTVRFPSIFGYMQTLLSIFQGPFLAILALGLLWPRATGAGALAGLGLGVATSSILFWIKDSVFTCPEPFLYIAWWSFLAGLVVTVGVSLFTRPEPRERIEGLVFTKMGKTGRSS